MKKIVIINGSPRLNGNTAKLTYAFAQGVKSILVDAEIITVNLYQLSYTGCKSCFACKAKNSPTYGKCAINDDLSEVLDHIYETDCLAIASPVYLMDINGQTKSFLERLCYPLGSYEKGYRSLARKRIPVVTFYTMNTTGDNAPLRAFENTEMFLAHIFSQPRRICSFNTYQFSDYSKYVVETFSEREKAEYRDKHFNDDITASYNVGKEIAGLM